MATKQCPFCREEINADAIKCRFCGEMLPTASADGNVADNAAAKSDAVPELFAPNTAGSWSLLFTAVFGSWCIWQNYRTLKEEDAAKRSRHITIGLLVAYILLLILPIPGNVAMCICFALLVGWYYAEQRRQVKFIHEHDIDYRKRAWMKPIAVAVAAVIGVFVIAAIFSDDYDEDMVIQTTDKIVHSGDFAFIRTISGIKVDCIGIKNVESIGNNKYRAKALLHAKNKQNGREKKGLADIVFEVVGDQYVVNMDFGSIVWSD